MKTSELKLQEIIEFSNGQINLKGRRLMLHDIRAFGQLRKDLVEMVGIDQARQVFTRFGFFWGNADAAAMTRIFEWDSLTEWLKAGPHMHALQGVSRTVVKSMNMDPEQGKFHAEITWHDSAEAEAHLAESGRADDCICWILVGYASGYATFCFGKNIYFVEKKCRARGDRVCTAIGKDEISWGSQITPYLHYFRAVDHIQAKIRTLTRQLQDKTHELERQRQHFNLAQDQTDTKPFLEIHSDASRRAVEVAARVAKFDTSVLITGESGVGKEILARYIHRLSNRAENAFVAVNCGALPETLLESELFGHRKGAFTGAVEDRVGLFEQANKGTVFLDEIGDISAAMQLKLLRVLQEREIMRVGQTETHPIDVRVMAATNRKLSDAISQGKFREDLYYRLGVVEIEVPPLRQRQNDILPLARHFVQRLAERLRLPELHFDATCLDYLQKYPWPGNVRELENALERAAVLCPDQIIRPECLPPNIFQPDQVQIPTAHTPLKTLAQMENHHISAILKQTNYNRQQAAKILGISPTTLWRKLKKQPNL